MEVTARLGRQPVPFEVEAAVLAARLFNLAGRRPGSFTDCMVAATALRHKAAHATASAVDCRWLEEAGLNVLAA